MKTKYRIYILDDSRTITTMVERAFTGMGYAVYADNNPKNCYERILGFSPDIIILDIDLNEYNGIDLCRNLQNDDRFAGIPIIFLSHITDTNTVAEGLEAGAVDYVTKPIDLSQLNARIKIILKMKEDAEDNVKLAKMSIVKAATVTVHHEINQPLSVILLSAEMLESRLSSIITDKDRVLIARIKNSIGKINDILHRFTLLHESEEGVELINYSDDSMMLKLPPSTIGRKVLVIDDQKEIIESVSDIIKNEGIDVLVADSKTEAERVFKTYSDSISFVLCDIMLGQENSLDLFHIIRKINPDVRFVFVTGYNPNSEMKRVIREFKIPLLKKPFSKRNILSLMKDK